METWFSEAMHSPSLRRRAGLRGCRLPCAVTGVPQATPDPRGSRSVPETRAGPCSPRTQRSRRCFPRAQDWAPRRHPGHLLAPRRSQPAPSRPLTGHLKSTVGKNNVGKILLGLAPARPEAPAPSGAAAPAPRAGGTNPRDFANLFFFFKRERKAGE